MANHTVAVKTPGKLMVAGEFAVLEPQHHLITMAVDRFVYVTIEDSLQNTLNLMDYHLMNIKWQFNGLTVLTESKDARLSFVNEAIKTTYLYLGEKHITPKACTLTIKSELADETGIKYGLGSSAAVVTAVVTALLNHNLKEKPDKMLIFKLASLAHVLVQKNGSGADIAASTFGGLVLYTSFQAEWLLQVYEDTTSLSSLVERDWTYLSIKELTLPKNFFIKVGWTGTPASTRSLVSEVQKLKTTNREQYDTFLQKSESAVERISSGIEQGDFSLLKESIEENRLALSQLGIDAGVDIETDTLELLSSLAQHVGGAGKLAGAGGGDCGIAFVPSEEKGNDLAEQWEEKGIKPLDLSLNKRGTEII